MIGHTVAGMKLLSAFGSTRAGELYLGECDDGRCIVKLLRPELCTDRARVDRALDAARTAGGLDHKGIEFVIEAGWDGDHAYLLGDIVPGTTADKLIARKSLEDDMASGIVRLAAEALAAAHAAGSLHLALEPALLHVGFATDRVLIRDFGVVELAGGVANAYRAPELWDGATSTQASDVWALGAIAFELACGRTPFGDDRPDGAAPDRGNIPVALDDVIEAMLASDPAARPTMAQVVEQLDGGAKPKVAAVMPLPPRPIKPGGWRCDRCGAHNLRDHAFCLDCSGPKGKPADVQSLMDSLAADASDEVTPPPGPPPEKPD